VFVIAYATPKARSRLASKHLIYFACFALGSSSNCFEFLLLSHKTSLLDKGQRSRSFLLAQASVCVRWMWSTWLCQSGQNRVGSTEVGSMSCYD